MLWWLPENGDLQGAKTEVDKRLWRKTFAAQALDTGLCPLCYLDGKSVEIKRTLVGLGWSNQRVSYHCPACAPSIVRQLTLQLTLIEISQW